MVVKSLIVQPDDGVEPVYALLHRAAREILIKMFTFDHAGLLDCVIAQHRRGVTVRVLLNAAKATGERINDTTFATLEREGIPVKWTCSHFLVTHEKTVVVDGERALVATFNFMEKYFSHTRDYGLIIADEGQVRQIRDCFETDWQCEDFRPDAHRGLAWSPGGARAIVCDVIDNARHTIDLQHPKFAEPVIFERLHTAIHRGVRVRVLCGGKHGLHQPDLMYSFAFWRLIHGTGAKVHKQRRLRTHGKLIIVDGVRAFLGTQNLDQPAFDMRREVSILADDPEVIGALSRIFQADWDESRKYVPPYPTMPPDDVENTEFAHDADLQHD